MASQILDPNLSHSKLYLQAQNPKPNMASSANDIILKYVALPNEVTDVQSHGIPFTDPDGTRNLPCRRCLQDTKAGEIVRLISYDHFPADVDSPYRGSGPVFVHENACTPFSGDSIPETQLQRVMSLRGFSKTGMMSMPGVDIASGRDFEKAAKSILMNEEVDYIDVHNAMQGCFALRVERAVA